MNKMLVVVFLLAASCSRPANEQASVSYDIPAEAPAPERAAQSDAPQIAYSYDIGYRLAAAQIAPVQARQAQLCRSLGPNRCLVLESSIDSSDRADASAKTSLVVDARIAPAFGSRLDALVSSAGGSVGNRRTAAEDVTKQVIDTDARVRAKEALADRLLGLIRTANGRVGDLVAAEKAYADTQEDLAAARSLQASLRQRVAMSRFDLDYTSAESTGPLTPLRQAVTSAGETIGWSLGALVTVALAALPWVLAVTGLAWLARRLGWRGPIARWRARSARGPAA
ncbi:DUF4349 domain-containing protein [Sphingomonas radiodurans]|uniref:DUF4349 domain-containing protein n=1 Tax=Sphingomonas radiodurans TaxID=2890321 RepID=UPI001E399B52|nr:DUF4349 domain-containing protein [Sphingomonas radiodurans]WBH16830.1 DUF4349 domain-containing protein [Sphingomonas radiodurans]